MEVNTMDTDALCIELGCPPELDQACCPPGCC